MPFLATPQPKVLPLFAPRPQVFAFQQSVFAAHLVYTALPTWPSAVPAFLDLHRGDGILTTSTGYRDHGQD